MGQVQATSISPGTIVNDDIAVGAGIAASKNKHHTPYTARFGYADSAGSIAVEDETFFIADGPGQIIAFKAWLVTAGSNTDIDFDVQINGTTVGTVANVVHGTGNNTAVAGVVSSGSFVAGDVITATIETVTQNTGAQGPRVQVLINHDYYAG